MTGSATICFAAIVSLAATSGAFAQTYYRDDVPPPRPLPAQPYPYPGWTWEGRSAAEQDRANYDWSGTRGRMGLGASPMHPEGPGNFSTPRP
ncbi:hypothetical protein [Methylocapsa acidiphila]|uniref:hypothetical protein n=1 Tax=Methylocapsa acidiphila TaxID=133552 RepID=UPI0003FD0178|nr:hypothetical protein [Methylocapsa acidiphila]